MNYSYFMEVSIMRKKLKRTLSLAMVILIVLSATPLAGLVGLDLPDIFTTKAETTTKKRGVFDFI